MDKRDDSKFFFVKESVDVGFLYEAFGLSNFGMGLPTTVVFWVNATGNGVTFRRLNKEKILEYRLSWKILEDTIEPITKVHLGQEILLKKIEDVITFDKITKLFKYISK